MRPYSNWLQPRPPGSSRATLLDGAVLTICLLGLYLAFRSRSFVFFRDYAITFEGSYRLFLGQIPYRDFGLPIGPVSFLLPALFFKLFNPTATVFLYTQQIENSIQLLLLYGLLCRLRIQPWVRRIGLISFSALYLLLLTQPWYNSTAALLLLACALTALFGPGIGSVIATGVLAGLTILAKQDFGVLAVLIGGFLVAIMDLGSDREHILTNLRSLTDAFRIRSTLIRLFVFGACASLPIVLCMLLTDTDQFLHWFNYGQPPHERRTLSAKDLFGNSYGSLALLSAIFALLRNNLRLLLSAIFITAASVTRHTSGLEFTHYYHVAFIPIILNEFRHLRVRWKPIVMLIVLYTSARVVIKPVNDVYHVFESIALHHPEHYFFDPIRNNRAMEAFPSDFTSFSPRTQAPRQTIDALRILKKQTATLRRELKGREPRILNISELTPLYAELAVIPPPGLPLWFHTGVSMFAPEIGHIEKLLAENEYDFILLQGAHGGLTDVFIRFLLIVRSNPRYTQLQNISDSPANATWPCEDHCDGNVYIFQLNTEDYMLPQNNPSFSP